MKKIILIAMLFASLFASANERMFTNVYEARKNIPGKLEIEQWFTWKTRKNVEKNFDRLDLRTEFEYSFTERFRAALYYDTRYQDGSGTVNDRYDFKDIALEMLYLLTDPNQDGIGTALYLEILYGDENEFFELEGKFIVTKDFGKWSASWNANVEFEWENKGLEERTIILGQVLGVSYEHSKKLRYGFEFTQEVAFDDRSNKGSNVMYLGPNVSWRTKSYWVTFTPTAQITNVGSEPEFVTRMIVGFDF